MRITQSRYLFTRTYDPLVRWPAKCNAVVCVRSGAHAQEVVKMAKVAQENVKGRKGGKNGKKDAKGKAAKAVKAAAIAERIRLDLSKKIHVLVDHNPKRPGTDAHARFELYKTGMTVGDFLEKAKAKGNTHPSSDIRYGIKHGFLELR